MGLRFPLWSDEYETSWFQPEGYAAKHFYFAFRYRWVHPSGAIIGSYNERVSIGSPPVSDRRKQRRLPPIVASAEMNSATIDGMLNAASIGVKPMESELRRLVM